MSEQLYIIVSPVTGDVCASLETGRLSLYPGHAKRVKEGDLPKKIGTRVLETFGQGDPAQWRYVGTCSDLIIKLAPQESEGS